MTRHDAVIVGGGHNGLVAAAYLARAGRSVLVLERREHAGGAAVSERPWPGVDARLSRYSYLVSLLPAAVARELGLGVRAAPARDLVLHPRPDGSGLLVRTERRAPHDAWRDVLRDDRARRPARVPDADAAAAEPRRAARRGRPRTPPGRRCSSARWARRSRRPSTTTSSRASRSPTG